MDKDDLLRGFGWLKLDYLRRHLIRSQYSTFEQWWPELVRDSPERSLLRRQARSMIYGLWCTVLDPDLWECYEYLYATGSNLEDIPWPIIETALERYITMKRNLEYWWGKKAHG
jgi:hypothetical protein